MVVLVCLELLIILFAAIMKYYSSYGGYIKKTQWDYTNNWFFVLCIFLPLVLFYGLRGDFTADYKNYVDVFKYIGEQNFYEIFFNVNDNHTELLYNIINKIVYYLTENEIILFLLLGIIMLALFVNALKENSSLVWLSLFLYVTTGFYFNSYNLVRVMIASAITFWGSKYIYKDEILKYLLVVFIASQIHTTALCAVIILIMRYVKLTPKVLAGLYVFVILVSVGIYFFMRPLAQGISQFIFTEYAVDGAYGMNNGLPLTSMTVPLLFAILIFIFKRYIDFNDLHEKIWFLCFVTYFVLCIATLRVEMMLWLGLYFAAYSFLLIPKLICKIRGIRYKIWCIVVVLLFMTYSVFSSFAKWEYVFFWQ